MENPLYNDWSLLLEDEFKKDYYLRLRSFLKKEYTEEKIHPAMEDIFNALHFTPFHKVKVVILGQDPYHGPDQAHGLSFSVQPGITIPPSLKNIFKELTHEFGMSMPTHGHLTHWAKQGVLLLNNVLTVREGKAHSHRGQGWEVFTDKVIQTLNQKDHPVVFLLWGGAAQKKGELIDTNKHIILKAPHPSPLSAYRGFFESNHFSKANQILHKNNVEEIDWTLPESPSQG
ncbi:uracil-DNA glycosylase [Oceanobacillus iheyensis HTE831]|uniref:Uracil-DNA glycosylase n=1 Tax=Oceanobacillus iheyensis (strain DSM 14371 / CIP 107618 / JCM 11309 / KCTC 3954 / HTE831) TaxID=221109 RepID=UNG_OCEIH|nr:uracil-DNA glycosylase [Oceanobacillus iheyensis]Q8EPH6.1 RecName: Full=Uracil-DNA glycosylase; Short=UDG [Oceanobacillus iheyensis HTE831]BAC14085.1 uracil-DNA glycosylase [Oceanobacillus iheyensis HTE831]